MAKLALTLLLFLTSFAVPAQAATPSGITIAPAVVELEVASQAQVKTTVSLTNNTATTQKFAITLEDFGSLTASGGLPFVGSLPSNWAEDYSLKSWLRAEPASVELVAGQTREITLMASNSADLTPGGHYGALVATLVTPQDGQVAIRPALSTLVMLKKLGGEQVNLSLSANRFNHTLVSLPEKTDLVFHNQGNVHLVPRGQVKIIDSAGRVIKQRAINEASAIVLPATERSFTSELRSVEGAWLPGRYQMEAAWRYDGQTEVKTESVSFLFFPPISLGIVFLLVIGGVLGWRRYLLYAKLTPAKQSDSIYPDWL